MSWRLVQGIPCPRPETRLGLGPEAAPRNPLERDKWLWTMTRHDDLYLNIYCKLKPNPG